MGVFDVAKAKVQGATGQVGKANSALGNAEGGALSTLSSGLGKVLNNDYVKTGLGAFNQATGLMDNVKGLIGAAKSFLADPYQVVPNPLLGGYSRKETQKQAQLAFKTAYAKNNLFLVRLLDKNYPYTKTITLNSENGLPDSARHLWDLLAVGVSFNPIAITGDAVKLGMLQGDSIQQSERVEVRMTLLDTAQGDIKRYLSAKKKQMINRDATANPPNDYVLEMLIIHIDQTLGRTKIGEKYIGVYNESELLEKSYTKHRYQVRVSTLDIDLNKREDSLQELQVTFTEVDPFMTPDRGQDGS
jgi:hypothetical protein